MAALLSTPRRRRKDRSCHFCGASEQSNCHCGGWSRKDENGNLIDYLPQMSDPNLNPKPHLAFSIPRILTVSRKPESSKDGAASSSDSQSSPFCSTCLANQNLQLNLLANYLPGDSDLPISQIRTDSSVSTRGLYDSLPAYKASLEARYPILCSTCSVKASEIIKERNYKVKAFSLNESVKRLAKSCQSRLNSTHPFSASNHNAAIPLSGMGGKLWTIQECLWRIQGLAWLSCYLVSISVAIYSSYTFQCQPIHTNPIRPNKPFGPLLVLSYLLLEIGCSFFDFTWARVRKNRAQGIRTKVIGKRGFVCLNVIACLLRLLLCFYFFDAGMKARVDVHSCDISDSFGNLMFGLTGALLATLLTASLTILKTDSPIGVKSLATKARSLAQSTPKPTPALAEDELFSTLSLSRPASSLSALKTVNSNSPTAVDRGSDGCSRLPVRPAFGKPSFLQGTFNQSDKPWTAPAKDLSGPSKDVQMDWEPSPDGDIQSNDILLRPQTFLPPPPFREETGIEDLFETKAKLVEGDDHQDKKLTGWLDQLFSVAPTFKKE
ncbi:hypothetical protein, variant [Puccinia triticina 1-1 BBBD Race 1]|uniref:Ima1_N domain-containing protein n=1 Tax=Puccinia triticina (isolate 1-1 / race 1 (BBBD)) TaxID=630390 RepID=A0A180GUY1_PUCT1|nr:hypothetical protein PTTG_12372 [Puccinia triticina 1-1 BBBD Race 1]OAV96324.1 hypothetical protein, variant [Puccinia triticina 1-1 BBBD Race 1]WAR53625.1 hypothetical protein PtB15_3B133 [Puccinia triticina]